MTQIDYYQVLGIAPTATADQVRAAFRRLARRIHPDTNPSWEDDERANQQMALLNEAYSVLRDPAQRAEYDRQRQMHRPRADPASRPNAAPTRPMGTPQRDSAADGWSELIFRPSRLEPLAVGLALWLFGAIPFIGLTKQITWITLLWAAAGFMSGALSLLAAIPYFQGYLELTADRLIEHSTFGLFPPREYRYDQICDVFEQIFRSKSGQAHYVVIRYYKQDEQGCWDVSRYHCRRLMRVPRHRELLYALRVRAQTTRFPDSRPTLWAMVVEMQELAGFLVGMFALMLFLIIVAMRI